MKKIGFAQQVSHILTKAKNESHTSINNSAIALLVPSRKSALIYRPTAPCRQRAIGPHRKSKNIIESSQI
jgi:hypothetical protein